MTAPPDWLPSRPARRAIVFLLGGFLLLLGGGVSVLGAGAAWWLHGLTTDFDVEAQPWQTAEVGLPEELGHAFFRRRRASPVEGVWEQRVVLVGVDGVMTELPLYDVGRAPVRVRSALWPRDGHPHLVLSDGHGTVAVDLERAVVRRLREAGDRRFLVDVTGVGGDGDGALVAEDGVLRFEAHGGASAEDVTAQWPPTDLVPLGRVMERAGEVRFDADAS